MKYVKDYILSNVYFIISLILVFSIVIFSIAFVLTSFINLAPMLGLSEQITGEISKFVIHNHVNVAIITFVFVYGWYLIYPMLHIQKWNIQIAKGNFKEPVNRHGKPRSRSKSGNIRLVFCLYRGLIKEIDYLTKALIKNEEDRKQLDKMRKEWIAGVSHDLKTPLSYVKGYSTMLLSKQYQWNEEEKQEFLQKIQNQALYMEECIEELNYSFQLESGELPINKEKKDIVEFIRCVIIDTVNHPKSKGRELYFESNIDYYETLFDSMLFKRALINILMNGAIHNSEGTIINTYLNVRQEDIIINVKDNGKGIDEETKKHIFERYHRSTCKDGNGLGMSIAKQFIIAHDGKINIHSEIDKGTSIIITLPNCNPH
ncbi:signal transduction histidine kinase [Clostridium tetanomorphum]|uniref:histidine kinase n=1 Tax=Clostridium tetanomorphum TaxID=1553 RepID=A0A923J0D8_CLOTT|nr:HAMP domain-containing sensor histidine kinase [Clostridium tetanomorphum]KAJ48873.1 two-component sensor histidine kinase [Clostridium tetanomorphum DSM 665]KAJ52963.1 two-component sensor histidine kinase [Clostridium tetanomorphum DSM 665]MBC2398216.1 HAMP domain-containing histidine kinase [Clostridium tetanomorphum]MBP1864903.1 signal transduction histidine kinase [Clostridium tetanomorphum]NRS83109.1 signal transduction histidine kinase [Clostridium tetanomorphum]